MCWHEGLPIQNWSMGRYSGLSIRCRHTRMSFMRKRSRGPRELSIRNMGRRVSGKLLQLFFFKWRIIQRSVFSTCKEKERDETSLLTVN